MEFSKDSEQGTFNQAIAYLLRLDVVLKQLDMASVANDYKKIYRLLFVFYKELHPMMNDKDKKTHKEHILEVKKKFKVYDDAIKNKKNKVPAETFDCLDAWEIELRDLMSSKGLLMPKKDDASNALK